MSKLLDDTMKVMKKFDPSMEATSPGYAEAIIMLSALTEGANEMKLAEDLGYDREFVDLVGNRLRNAGIWVGDSTNGDFFDRWSGEGGGISFLCDVNVADGSFVIAKTIDGEPKYKMSESGKRRVEQILVR